VLDLDVKKIPLNTYISMAIGKVKIKIGFKYGVQIAFPAKIVLKTDN
jgi:hypothetical protein